MSGVFQILTPHPLPARRVCTPAFRAGGGHTLWEERGGGGVNILEDARHSSVLYICKSFEPDTGHPPRRSISKAGNQIGIRGPAILQGPWVANQFGPQSFPH